MARSRNIKPSFFKNELLGQADPLLSLLFASLWTLADRQGRLEDRPLRIKAETFPYRDIPDFNGYLTQLEQHGFIERYVVGEMAIIQVVNFRKHQAPHNTEKASELPEKPIDSPVTVKQPLKNAKATQAKRPDSLNLIPDSCNTDSLISDSLIPELSSAPKVADTELQNACKKTWAAYSTAYLNRYGTEPIRNAGVNSMVKQFVQKIGFTDSPFVAEFFVQHNDRFYVQKTHAVALMNKDAEGLRTQWATGRSMTATRATQIDKTQANFSVVGEAMKILEAQNNAKNT